MVTSLQFENACRWSLCPGMGYKVAVALNRAE